MDEGIARVELANPVADLFAEQPASEPWSPCCRSWADPQLWML